MSTRVNFSCRPPVIMKAVVICDDFDFATSAASTLMRVGRQTGVNVHWTTKNWPLNDFKDLAFAQEALAEALDSHIIVLPGNRASTLPSWIWDWLTRWAVGRTV